jgi:hypothetical protein
MGLRGHTAAVYVSDMNAYATTLKHYLETPGVKQETLAAAVKRTQPSIWRYANDERFPDAVTARLIDEATGGVVPFALWQSVAMKRLGISATPEPADTARAA